MACLKERREKMAGYKLKIDGIEIFVDSLDDLKRLIKEFGSKSEGTKIEEPSEFPETDISRDQRQSKSLMDEALLKRFIEADRKGIPSTDLQVRLGANKKTLKAALETWAKRLNLWQNSFEAIFEYGIFSGNRRGYRLTREATGVAKDLVGTRE
jgi:hypothetical protein